MKRQIVSDTLKKDRHLLILFAAMTVVNLSVFLLYHIMTEAFWYVEIISFVILVSLIAYDFTRNLKTARVLENAYHALGSGNNELPQARTYEETRYHEMVDALTRKINALNLSFEEEKQDWNDWYTVWVHQIKTPIAVLKLRIPKTEKETINELFRIEEYADMALSYIRLGSTQNDLVIREYSLDELIRETFRKYASQFIARKIRLEYQTTGKIVVTDKKWLLCILEQYISNAVKYTDGGVVTVTVAGDTLTVTDTGIGIASEDLPRIFEKGYTGNNGRTDARSSGLGLYLAARAARLIDVRLSAESTYGEGSKFSVIFPEIKDV